MAQALSRKIDCCRLCDSRELETILDLGNQPPANSLRASLSDTVPTVPLVLCRCKSCGVAQLTETIQPEFLFSQYVWVTGTSKGAQSYGAKFCDEMLKRVGPVAAFAVEVASNDGTFLRPFKDRGVRVLGVDPARNIAAEATKSGIETVPEFFGAACARNVTAKYGQADIAFARNVLPHVPDPKDVIAGLAECLKDTGVGAIEFHRADTIVRELHYDSIYHEHFFYYTLRDVEGMLNQAGLTAFDVMESPISGGSWVVYFSKQRRPATDAITKARDGEAALHLDKADGWMEFARQCKAHREQFTKLLRDAKAKGGRIYGYGASARSSTLLNYCGVGPSDLDCVVDKSGYKHDKFTAGTNLPIVAPEKAFANPPDRVVLLAWNFTDEILDDMKRSFNWSGPVLLPLPGEPKWIRE
jgi:SAM-dependent methyltransferase